MSTQLPMNEARKLLPQLADQFEAHPNSPTISITRRGKPVLAVMSWDLYETVMETMDILEDKALMKSLKKSVQQIKSGQTIPWEKIKQDLDR